METPADATEQPKSSTTVGPGDGATVAAAPTSEPATERTDEAAAGSESAGPTGLRLAVSSVGVFLAIVAIGGIIGVTSGAGNADASTASAMIDTAALDTAMIDTAVVDSAVFESAILDAAVARTDAAPETTAPEITAPETTAVPTTLAPAPTTSVAAESEPTATITAADVTVTEPVTVVRGVTELALPLVDEAPTAAPVTGPDPTEIEFLELPKAVYDRFTLRTGDSFAINIAANDKIGGVLQSVTLTGLGELAPGFSLSADGTVSGVASECGAWRAQYAINSTNPAVGTSWIDITVSGCSGT